LEWPLSGINETATLRVFNATGATVLLREISISGNVFQKTLSVKDWAKGVYFVQLRTRSGIVSGRFVKE
ncbi:MAG: T9SS type A sorting domain-containing protein, partial [Saprospiraceae bacterium]|nr:T9SS type A sorting domain-containing protein [Saprospiraceae bacterium]